MKKEEAILAWTIVILSLVIAATILESVIVFETDFIDLRFIFMFLFLIPIGTAAYYFRAKATITVTVTAFILAGMTICWPQVSRMPLSSWKNGGLDFEYFIYVLKPLIASGLIWQLLSFLLFGSWIGVILQDSKDKTERVDELGRTKKKLEAKLKEQADFFNTLQYRRKEDTTRLGALIITLSELAREIPSILEPDVLFGLILEKTVKLFSAKQCAIFSVDSARNKLSYICSYGHDEEQLKGLTLTADDGSGIIGWCAKTGKFLSYMEAKADAHMADLLRNEKIKTTFCQPIMCDGEAAAVICVGQMQAELDQKEIIKICSLLNSLTAIAMENAQLMERIKEQAIRDGLTGLHNHRFFQESLEKRLNQAKTEDILGLFLLDVDHFKKFNDTYGHQAGDFILQEVAKILKLKVKPEDLVARYGGEEFVAIISGPNEKTIIDTAEKIRKTVEKAAFKTGKVRLSVTASLGGTIYKPEKLTGIKKDELIKQADQALYQAKEKGRNQVVIFDTGE